MYSPNPLLVGVVSIVSFTTAVVSASTNVTGIIAVSSTIAVSAIGATWIIGSRFSKLESKLDSHISYHEGQEDEWNGKNRRDRSG